MVGKTEGRRPAACSCCSWLKAAVKIAGDIKGHTIERIGDFFAWWASIAFDHPYKCIFGTLAVVGILCTGFIPGIPIWIDGAEALYSLPFSVARSQGAVHAVLFNESAARPSFIIVTGRSPGENILTWKHLEAMQQLDRLIRGQIVDPRLGRRVALARRPEYNTHHHQYYYLGNKQYHSGGGQYHRHRLEKRHAQSNYFDLGQNLSVETENEQANKLVELLNRKGMMAYNGNNNNDRGDAGREVLTFQDICALSPFGDCSVSGILEMGIFDVKETLLREGDPPMLLLFDGLAFNARKKGFPPHYFLGNATEEPCSPDLPTSLLKLFYKESLLMPGNEPGLMRANMTCITRAEAFQTIYETRSAEQYRQLNEDWEKVLVEVLSDNLEFGPLRLSMNAFRSRDDALRSSTSESSDVLFVVLTFGLLVAYASTLNFSCDLYRSKSYPALAGVSAAILGMVAGMGMMSLCGIAFVPTTLVCPFLVVGVGTDDMFVIINAYSLAYMIDSSRQRCILALRDTGLAITITTATSLISFIIGLNTGYLSIRNFCWFCGAGEENASAC